MCFRGLNVLVIQVLATLLLCLTGRHVVCAILDIRLTARVGERVPLPCRVPYNTHESLVQWFMGENQLSVGLTMITLNPRMEVDKPVPNEYNLIIKSVAKADEEIFMCKSFDQEFSRISLQVQWRPEFDESESSPYQVAMTQGGKGQLSCMAEGRPKPVITWYRRPQHAGSTFREIGVTGQTLTFHDVTRYVNDVFMCNASNVQGYVTREMNVTVQYPPEVYIYEQDLYVQPNEQVLVTCLVQGSPLVDLYWQFGGTRIETNWKYLVHVEHEEGYPMYFMTLMVRKGALGLRDFGIYACHADGKDKEAEIGIRIEHTDNPGFDIGRERVNSKWPTL